MLACFDLLIYGMGGRTHPDTNSFSFVVMF